MLDHVHPNNFIKHIFQWFWIRCLLVVFVSIVNNHLWFLERSTEASINSLGEVQHMYILFLLGTYVTKVEMCFCLFLSSPYVLVACIWCYVYLNQDMVIYIKILFLRERICSIFSKQCIRSTKLNFLPNCSHTIVELSTSLHKNSY